MPTNRARAHPPTIHAALAEKHCQPDAVLEHIDEGADIIVGMFNSESLTVLDALEANAERLSGLRIHQMFPFRERDYMPGGFTGLRHVSWFLSSANREAFRNDTCDLIPNNFSDVPALMRRATRRSLAPCCRRSSGSPRLLLAWHQRRLCGGADRGSAFLRRDEP
jgi:hypothetical protein